MTPTVKNINCTHRTFYIFCFHCFFHLLYLLLYYYYLLLITKLCNFWLDNINILLTHKNTHSRFSFRRFPYLRFVIRFNPHLAPQPRAISYQCYLLSGLPITLSLPWPIIHLFLYQASTFSAYLLSGVSLIRHLHYRTSF